MSSSRCDSEQVHRSAETDILMGVHGNGLSHVLWIRRPGALIEIFPSENRLLAFQQFCEISGLLYYGLEASSGVVHREGSCTSSRSPNGRWYPPATCRIGDATINQISADLDINHIVCLVYDALFSMQKIGLDPRRSCRWPACTLYLGLTDSTAKKGCWDGEIEYECTDFGPVLWASSAAETTPNEYCLDREKSESFCSPGEFLCKVFPESGWKVFLKGLQKWKFCQDMKCDTADQDEWWRTLGMRSGFAMQFGVSAEKTMSHKLCVLLPYRDGCQQLNRARVGERAEHLKTFLRHMQKFLQSAGHTEIDLIVVEQTPRGLFKKGVLYYVGVNVALHRGCDFIALHDIDHLPMDQRNNYSFPSRPIHLCTNSSDVGWERFAGGAVLMQMEHFALINGFSNLYNGWGAEDSDLYDRVEKVFGSFQRLDPAIGFYIPLKHEVGIGHQVTELGEDSHPLNLEILEKQRNSNSRFFMDLDGYLQLRSSVSILNISVSGNVVTATVDVLKDGSRQNECKEHDNPTFKKIGK